MNKVIVNCTTGEKKFEPILPEELLPPPTTEQLLSEIRVIRNQKLSACDWTQLADSPLTTEKKQEWTIYRQLLRDMPETCDLYNPVWPTTPL